MPGNVPNISRDSFQFAKFYDGCRLQQGVPIPDSDWNELEDIRRIMEMLEALYVWGDDMMIANGLVTPGFYPVGDGSVNDFEITGGWAIVKGVQVPTTPAEPPATIRYDGVSNFIVDNGVVGSIPGANQIDDPYKRWQAHHDLAPTANHGGARVRYTSGAEIGNTYAVVTVDSATQLTLAGGAPAPGDTYIILPPALTTPGAPRTDEIYLMVWWEDVAAEEDTGLPLTHPGLGVETCHRMRRRWCVRVSENGSTPATVAKHGFGARYMRLGVMNRIAAAAIQANHVTGDYATRAVTDYKTHSLYGLAHGVGGNYTSEVVTDVGDGGIGTGHLNIEAVLDEIDAAVIRRRAFTAVLTHAVDSQGGDVDSSFACDALGDVTLDPGLFMLRRGTYTWSAVSSLGAAQDNCGVIGECRTNTSISLPAGSASAFALNCYMERLRLKTAHATWYYNVRDTTTDVRLVDCDVDSGVFRWQQGGLYWHLGRLNRAGGVSTNSYGLQISQAAGWGDHRGIIEGVHFEGPSSAAGVPLATILLANLSKTSYDDEPIVIRQCLIEAGGSAADCLNIVSCEGVEIVFEDCVFIGGGDPMYYCVYGLNSDGLTFRNCIFYNDGGPLIQYQGGVLFENCIFCEGATDHTQQTFVVRPKAADIEHTVELRHCYLFVDGGLDPISTKPLVEIGGINGAQSGLGNIVVHDFRVGILSGDYHRYSLVVIYGPDDHTATTSVRDLVIDMNSSQIGVARGVNGVLGRSSILELVGDVTGRPKLFADNVQIVNMANPSVADSGSVCSIRRAIVRGLLIDTDLPPGGAGSIGSVDGILNLLDMAEVSDLELFPTSSLVQISSATIYIQGDYAGIRSGTIYNCTTAALTASILVVGDYCFIHGLQYLASPASSIPLLSVTGINGLFSNNRWYPGNARSGLREFRLNLQNSFIANVWRGNWSGTDTVDGTLGGGILVVGNTLLSTSINVPNVNSIGAGSVTGNNVMIASAI